ncbi:MAG TPA: hypothetical protein VG889_21165 [Rhizomicrobium sp.]|nr:hypothetical protein [Rhizomicrobium sp.]
MSSFAIWSGTLVIVVALGNQAFREFNAPPQEASAPTADVDVRQSDELLRNFQKFKHIEDCLALAQAQEAEKKVRANPRTEPDTELHTIALARRAQNRRALASCADVDLTAAATKP